MIVIFMMFIISSGLTGVCFWLAWFFPAVRNVNPLGQPGVLWGALCSPRTTHTSTCASQVPVTCCRGKRGPQGHYSLSPPAGALEQSRGVEAADSFWPLDREMSTPRVIPSSLKGKCSLDSQGSFSCKMV